MQCRMILYKVMGIRILHWRLHLAQFTEDCPSKLGVLERQALNALNHYQVRSRSFALVKASDSLLLVHHLVLLLKLHEVSLPGILISSPGIRVHSNARAPGQRHRLEWHSVHAG